MLLEPTYLATLSSLSLSHLLSHGHHFTSCLFQLLESCETVIECQEFEQKCAHTYHTALECFNNGLIAITFRVSTKAGHNPMTVNLPVFSLASKKIRQAIGLEAISACARSKQIKYDDLICWDYFCSNQNNIEVDF